LGETTMFYRIYNVFGGRGIRNYCVRDAGMGGLILWPVFGTTNQLLAALALLVITLYLLQTKKPVIYTVIPMIFMMITTVAAMALNIQSYYADYITSGKPDMLLLTGIGIAIFVLALWLVFEAWNAYRNRARGAT